MKFLKNHSIILIPLALLLAFLVLPLLDNSPGKSTKHAKVYPTYPAFLLLVLFASLLVASCTEGQQEEGSGNIPTQNSSDDGTGFPDYHWLPEQLKQQMEHLVNSNPGREYYFYYYFKSNDLHQHFFLDDFGVKVIAEMPVTHEMALERVEEQLFNVEVRRKGIFVALDTSRHVANPPRRHQLIVGYILPEGNANFRQLRVAIVEIPPVREGSYEIHDTTVYQLHEVDVPPHPLRGMEYFRRAVRKEAQLDQVLALFDTGTVIIEFTVGFQAQVLDVVKGLEDWSDSYEAYQADSEFMKALHNAKVWWKPAVKQGRPVQTKMQITFQIDSNEVNLVIPQPSSL